MHNEFLVKIEKIVNHKNNVIKNGHLLAMYFAKESKYELAKTIIKLSYEHDQSKFDGIEWEGLLDVNHPKFKDALTHHRSVNKHHIEYWPSIDHVPEEYLAELLIDLISRAQEQVKDVRVWIDEVLINRHGLKKDSMVYIKIQTWLNAIIETWS